MRLRHTSKISVFSVCVLAKVGSSTDCGLASVQMFDTTLVWNASTVLRKMALFPIAANIAHKDSRQTRAIFVTLASFLQRWMARSFMTGGWSPCRQSKRIDKAKPVCRFVFRYKHALLQQTFGLEHVSSQEKYSQWLGQRHVTFGCNGLYVFYWYMDRYISFISFG